MQYKNGVDAPMPGLVSDPNTYCTSQHGTCIEFLDTPTFPFFLSSRVIFYNPRQI